MQGIKDLGKYKPLCHTKHGLLLYKKNNLYTMDYYSEQVDFVCSLPLKGFKNVLANTSRLFERMFRAYARSSIALDSGALVTFNSGIYNVNFEKKTAIKEHDYCKGMNNPIGFSNITGIESFDDCVVYGEYTGNELSKPVSIHTRNKHGKWNLAHTFGSGTIKHIHAIVPDPFRKNVLILTGDADEESGIWVAENNFQKVYPLIVGKQLYRSCAAWPVEGGILYATDTPLEN
ncbi:MAG: hypothetical protein EOM76_13130, partial [Sphingobacteriia bacterium]|nr:hypothetical protein [Sphingobacteriia bacterium]